ncbi:FAD-binding protein [candidate division TA06 bacterium]|uniref:FAD-binding protein n=1 Tax=candidate division TA06 bacterium TaxID=2250710 RepID=A0A523UW03_UNCT6|nr:MAG: FAD-binding protein [candidate division TA06 bacterium]
MVNNSARKRLKEIFGGRVLFAVEERLCYSFDATNVEYLPDCVAFPLDVEEVVKTVALAVEETIPLIPRGAGSGFSGGAVAVKGGVVLSFEKMHRTEKMDRDALTAMVQPGVVTKKLQDEAAGIELFYPPDPASLSFSMIGGNIGTNAGGPRAIKYGTTRDYVIDLEVVTPAYGLISTAKKGCGFDLTPLFVGAEGILGVIVRAKLRLINAPETTKTILACFKSMRKAAEALDVIIEEGIIPSTAEFIDKPTVECVFGKSETEKDLRRSNVLIIEVDGWQVEVEELSKLIVDRCRNRGAHMVRFARSEREREEIWSIRRGISPALANIAPHKINPDVCVPRSRLPEYLSFVSLLSKRYSLRIFNFGHAGDGNIHTNIMFDGSRDGERRAAERALTELFEKTVELGGTISGEHGVGMARRKAIRLQIGPKELRLRRKLKSVFDPLDIMNPAKGL